MFAFILLGKYYNNFENLNFNNLETILFCACTGKSGGRRAAIKTARSTVAQAKIGLSNVIRKVKSRRRVNSREESFIRLIDTIVRPFVVDAKDTLACAVLGKEWGLVVGAWSRNPCYTSMIYLAYILGSLTLLSSWFRILDRGLSLFIGSVLTIPCVLILILAPMNVTLMKMLAGRFETLYSLFNMACFSVGFVVCFPGDGMMIFSLLEWNFIFASLIFLDALPHSRRRMFATLGCSYGVLWVSVSVVGLHYNWFGIDSTVELHVGEITWTGNFITFSYYHMVVGMYFRILRSNKH